MVKIEGLSADACVWFTRDNLRQRAYLQQLISIAELETLEVESGTVTYSVNEQSVLTRSAETAKVTEQVEVPALVESEQPLVTAKPKIVFPKKKK